MANTTGKKHGGRQKGTPNRSTSETKELLQNVLNKQLDKLEVTLNKLKPSERVNALSKLLPYILPKQQDIVIEVAPPINEEQREKRIAELKKRLLEK
jgi:hypothetical protein